MDEDNYFTYGCTRGDAGCGGAGDRSESESKPLHRGLQGDNQVAGDLITRSFDRMNRTC